MPFKPGDIVILKSGGPFMTVISTDNGKVKCTWFDEKNTNYEKEFDEACIEASDGMPPPPTFF